MRLEDCTAYGVELQAGDKVVLRSSAELDQLRGLGVFDIIDPMIDLGGNEMTIARVCGTASGMRLPDGTYTRAYRVAENNCYWYDVLFEPAAPSFSPPPLELLFGKGVGH